ncbi:ATP-binding protein [Streptomyces sp. NPDC060232]|uniref:ATP-binding protein n=1 Tax=Streptomyces sp. NPDC060232 TaxID=3347079 RepID=UPI003647AD3E
MPAGSVRCGRPDGRGRTPARRSGRRNTGRPLAGTGTDLTEPFQRGTERVRTGEHAGAGLGPAIVHSVVRAHDAALDLSPRPTGGLVVTVRVPAAA